MPQTDLALDVIKKKVFYHNSVDVWISACEEKNIDWNSIENYKKFRLEDNVGNKTLLFCFVVFNWWACTN